MIKSNMVGDLTCWVKGMVVYSRYKKSTNRGFAMSLEEDREMVKGDGKYKIHLLPDILAETLRYCTSIVHNKFLDKS